MINLNLLVSGLYGLVVIASGVIRYLERPDGEKGLWFGLVMGSLPLIASMLFYRQNNSVARFLIWTCLPVIGGWFVYEALFVKGIHDAELRMLIIIGLTLATAIFFLTHFDQNAGSNRVEDQ